MVRRGAGRAQRLLAPLGRLYGWFGERRFRSRQPYRSRFPVICVGNFTAGGTGKTPLAILIAELLKARGQSPVFLTRGFGGTAHGPAWVDEAPAAAHRFGDEPLLLARVAPTLVSRDRKAGILMLEASGRKVSAVIMDDGLQNPALAKDFVHRRRRRRARARQRRGDPGGTVARIDGIPARPCRCNRRQGAAGSKRRRAPGRLRAAEARVSRPSAGGPHRGAGRHRLARRAACCRLRRHRQPAALLSRCSRAWGRASSSA